jgi:phosphocarrier protein
MIRQSITISQFESEVYLERAGNRVNAKSIMGVMMLAASKGVELELEIDGNDEQACQQALVELIESRFGESE